MNFRHKGKGNYILTGNIVQFWGYITVNPNKASKAVTMLVMCVLEKSCWRFTRWILNLSLITLPN